MIIYNVTTNVDEKIHDEWVMWMKEKHLPDVMATGLPIGNRFLKLLTEIDNGGVTYSVQYFVADIEDYEVYQNQYSPALRADFDGRFKGQYVSFRTLLEDVK